jgi:hypothetical protein
VDSVDRWCEWDTGLILLKITNGREKSKMRKDGFIYDESMPNPSTDEITWLQKSEAAGAKKKEVERKCTVDTSIPPRRRVVPM